MQQGTIKSESLISSKAKQQPAQPSTSVVHKRKIKETDPREEIFLMKNLAQSKIANQIKPRLQQIVKLTSKPMKNGLIKSYPQQPKINNRPVEIKKTKLTNGIEIYRYNTTELFSLQKFATWELVPRLLQLKICATSLSNEEELVLELLNLSHEERQNLILEKAVKMKFIKKIGNNFSFISCKMNQRDLPDTLQPQQLPSLKKEEEKKSDFERLKLLARNDEELNDLIYQHELINLFGSELQDKDLQDQSHENIVKHLLDANKAYIVEGEIRVNQKNVQEAYVSHRKGMKDICINRLILRKHAFHGDLVRVLVKVNSGIDEIVDFNDSNNIQSDDDLNEAIQLDETSPENRNFGCVLEIVEKRHPRRVIGSFAPFFNISKNRKHLMVIVRDPKVPNVRVSTLTGVPTDTALNDKLLLNVEITSWSHDQPQGKVVSIIGQRGQLKTENTAILLQNNLDPTPYDKSIIDELPSDPFVIPEEEFQYRLDLRKKCIFSIDPESARDLDDALSCDVLPNGNLEVGVHISDVSYFVKENSPLDLIVKDKATTIYLVDAVYHMLPEQLCLLCSLLPGADKMAYSVIYEMNPDTAEIYNTRFTRSIINSCAKLSYDHAQMVIEKKDCNWKSLESEFPEILNNFNIEHIANVIKKLQKIAIILRATRKENGALKIDQPKLSFKFEKDDQRMEAPIDFYKYRMRDSNRLIEEFMLLANVSVATFINEKFPKISLLRQHAAPNDNGIKKLAKNLANHNILLDTSSSKTISKSMENIVTFAKNPSAMSAALSLLVSRTMKRANYFCSGFAEKSDDYWHYALSIPIYTHFTSPIRRYADILVHRVLNAALNYEEKPTRTPEEIQMNATVCNAQKYAAKLAGDDSTNLYFMHFIQSLGSKAMTAAIVGIFDHNFEVVLIDSGHLVKIYYKVIVM